MVDFLYNVVLYVQIGLLIFAVIMLYVNIEILKYREANHGTDLSKGLPEKR